MTQTAPHVAESVLAHVRRDFASLAAGMTVRETLDAVRENGVGEKVVYFCVVDAEQQLVGVVPTSRLFTAPVEQQLAEIMVQRVVSVPQSATLLEACELFVLHRFLAFPVVDEQRRIVGVVDSSLFAQEVFNLAEQERMDEVFEVIGFHVSQVRDALAWRASRFRFPWLLVILASGTIWAFLAGAFELTLAKSLVLPSFLTLVLGLGKSVSM